MLDNYLECDINGVLSSWRERDDFPVLQRLEASFAKFRSLVLTSAAEKRRQKKEIMERNKKSLEIISHLSGQVKEAEYKLKNVPLQRKVMEKQINNVLRQQDKLKEELGEETARKESLSLEMIDLEQEHEERKKEKQLVWDALKRASRVYKSSLCFHIKLVDSPGDTELVEISFFKQERPSGTERCHVDLVRSANGWKVEELHPVLKPEHEDQLKEFVDFSKTREVRNMPAFLCQIRSIFLKHYLSQ